MSLSVIPYPQRLARAFVAENHRHHKPPAGALFSLAALDGERVCGVVFVGRPSARMLQDGLTCEVTRCCTDGTRNACSILYGRARRAAFALGYRRVITYTLPEEGGASLRASGWKCIGPAGGGRWSRKSRERSDEHPTQEKLRWETQA